MRFLKSSIFVAAALSAIGSAWAGEAPAKPDPRIGPEVDRICFARNINGWKALKGEDDVVLLESGVNDWYRVETTGGCRESAFRFAEVIGLEQRPAGGCVTRGDVIIVRDSGDFTRRCFISKINKWDDKAKAPEVDRGDDDKADASGEN